MTSVFDERGTNLAVTAIEVEPCVITQVKTDETNGYNSVQLASVEKKEKSATQPERGHFDKAGSTPKKYVKEFRDFELGEFDLGDELTVDDVFEVGQSVDVVGYTKGRGFTGVIKRHNFHGVGESTHGQADRQRAPGAIGNASDPSRVFKGKKMAGRSGNERRTEKNLTIAKILSDSNILLVTGSIPGPKGRVVEIYHSKS